MLSLNLLLSPTFKLSKAGFELLDVRVRRADRPVAHVVYELGKVDTVAVDEGSCDLELLFFSAFTEQIMIRREGLKQLHRVDVLGLENRSIRLRDCIITLADFRSGFILRNTSEEILLYIVDFMMD